METHTTFMDVAEANHEKEGWTSPQGRHEKVSLVVNQDWRFWDFGIIVCNKQGEYKQKYISRRWNSNKLETRWSEKEQEKKEEEGVPYFNSSPSWAQAY
jgi:hypothetical protein